MTHVPSEDSSVRAEPLPQGARLLHIGQMKTGTTSLQSAASSRRAELRELGVCYPGRSLFHRNEIAAALWANSAPKWRRVKLDSAFWVNLLKEVRRAPDARSLISYELIVDADTDEARKLVDDLGPQTYVVITVRSFGSVLPSAWQQYVKNGTTQTFDAWLRRTLTADRGPGASSFWVRHDLAAQLERWAPIVGDDHLIVVVLDKSRPELITDAFEGLLDLPPGMLVADDLDGRQANRGMSPIEAELVRRVNVALADYGHDKDDYYWIVRGGMIVTLLRRRTPTSAEGRLGIPGWAAPRIREIADGYVTALTAWRARVIGDPAGVTAPGPMPVEATAGDDVVRGIAVDALRGMISRAAARGLDFDQPAPPAAPTTRGIGNRRWFRRVQDVLLIDVSSTHIVDRLRTPEGIVLPGETLAGCARTVGATDAGRLIVADVAAFMDDGVRERLRAQLRAPKVFVVLDADRADIDATVWEQALATGETRVFAEWAEDERSSCRTLLADIRRVFPNVTVVRAAADVDVLRPAQRWYPSLTLDERPRRALSATEVDLVRSLNLALQGTDLAPAERRTLVGIGVMDALRIAPASRDIEDVAVQALTGVFSVATGRGAMFERALEESTRIVFAQ